jgi:hypothetical protein
MPEDHKLALAAVVVTGIVGVTGPLITWRATRDAQQTAGRIEEVQADRAEIRRVLDRAIGDLLKANRAGSFYLQWSASDPLGSPRQQMGWSPSDVRGRRFPGDQLDEAITAARRSDVRLRIRLGDRSPVVSAYSQAVDAYQDMTTVSNFRVNINQDEERAMRNAAKRVAQFMAAAHRLVRSSLD